MKKNIKTVLSFGLIFIGITVGLLILMICVAKIPKKIYKTKYDRIS